MKTSSQSDPDGAQMETKMEPEAYYVEFKPDLWHRLGFRECGAPMMEDEEFPDLAVGRMTTHTTIVLDWKDRLRLLVSGRLMCSMSQKTDVMVNTCVSRSQVSVMRPGGTT